MVTNKLSRRYKILAKDISKEYNLDLENVMDSVERSTDESRRRPAPSAPKGGIGIRAAARKYKMRHTTIVLWVREGYIPVILETKNEKYIDESRTLELINKFKHYMGSGRKTIKKVLSGDNSCSAS